MEKEILPQVITVADIQASLEEYVGKRLHVRANLGRSKILERDGELTQVHNSLFIMVVDEKRGRTSRQSYQYVDVLTGMVKLTDLETGELLFKEIEEQED